VLQRNAMLYACTVACVQLLICVSVLDYVFFGSSVVILFCGCKALSTTEAWSSL